MRISIFLFVAAFACVSCQQRHIVYDSPLSDVQRFYNPPQHASYTATAPVKSAVEQSDTIIECENYLDRYNPKEGAKTYTRTRGMENQRLDIDGLPYIPEPKI